MLLHRTVSDYPNCRLRAVTMGCFFARRIKLKSSEYRQVSGVLEGIGGEDSWDMRTRGELFGRREGCMIFVMSAEATFVVVAGVDFR